MMIDIPLVTVLKTSPESVVANTAIKIAESIKPIETFTSAFIVISPFFAAYNSTRLETEISFRIASSRSLSYASQDISISNLSWSIFCSSIVISSIITFLTQNVRQAPNRPSEAYLQCLFF